MSRRDFLVRMSALFAMAAMPPSSRFPAQTGRPLGLDIFTRRYPRVFAFRQAEILANLRSYRDWEDAFLPLSGVAAKLLPEERSDTVTQKNLIYVTRLKQKAPEKLALLHLNGQARLPTFETDGWFAGWWLYRAGTSTLETMNPATTVIPVANVGVFTLTADGFGESWEDLVLTLRGSSGLPDFSTAEHIRLVAIDGNAGTLEVERGCYGSTAQTWPIGSYIAAHVTKGPFFRGGDKVWFYNFTPISPREQTGRHVIDAIIAGLQPRFAPGGAFEILDGIELDVFKIRTSERQGVDADGDGVADHAMEDGVDLYTLGLAEFSRQLRAVLGSNRLLLVDGGDKQYPDLTHINGVELEGMPSLLDIDQMKWSQGLATLKFYGRAGCVPKISYGMYKFSDPLDTPLRFSTFRMALAATLLAGSAFTFYDEPNPGSTIGLKPGPRGGLFPNQFTIWDEILAGDFKLHNWLGEPLAPAVHLVESQPDLYGNKGTTLPDDFVNDIRGVGVSISRLLGSGGPYLLLRGEKDPIRITLPPLSTAGPDLTLILDVNAVPLESLFPRIPRFMTVATCGQRLPCGIRLTVPVDETWNHLILAFRRVPGGTVSLRIEAEGKQRLRLRRIRVVAAPDLAYREFQNGAVFVNPSDSPATFELSALLAGSAFRRLLGSVDQDPVTNNGKPVGATLTIPAIDALTVIREGKTHHP